MAKQKKEKQIPFKQQVYEQMLTSQLYGDQSPTSQANLDKIQKSTGLDLRVFEDAITFKIALMVVRYMKYMETMEF